MEVEAIIHEKKSFHYSQVPRRIGYPEGMTGNTNGWSGSTSRGRIQEEQEGPVACAFIVAQGWRLIFHERQGLFILKEMHTKRGSDWGSESSGKD